MTDKPFTEVTLYEFTVASALRPDWSCTWTITGFDETVIVFEDAEREDQGVLRRVDGRWVMDAWPREKLSKSSPPDYVALLEAFFNEHGLPGSAVHLADSTSPGITLRSTARVENGQYVYEPDELSFGPPVTTDRDHAKTLLNLLLAQSDVPSLPWTAIRVDNWTGPGTAHVWQVGSQEETFEYLPASVDGPAFVKWVNDLAFSQRAVEPTSVGPSVRFQRLHPDAKLPERMTPGSAGLDLFARIIDALDNDNRYQAIYLDAGRKALVSTGIAVAIPPGYEGQIRPRSGLASKHGMTVLNSPGTIDSDYRGEIKVLLVNHGACSVQIQHGDRIAQLVICPVATPEIVEVDELPGSERGDGGFGSTGR